MGDTVFWLGYDVRAVRNPAKQVTRLLLRQPDDDLYSVDDMFWPSLWSTCLDDAPRPEFLGPTQNLWAEFSELLRYSVFAMAGRECGDDAVFVAVEVVVPSDEPELEMSFWRGRNEPVEVVPEANRILLGYDVADWYLGSWLYWSDNESPSDIWRATFGEREGIARTGLLVDEASARALVNTLEERGKRDWYVYRLWRMDSPDGYSARTHR